MKGVSITTLRRWEADGTLVPIRTKGGRRRYLLSQAGSVDGKADAGPLLTIAYARVSSHDQKDALECQKKVLEMYCASRGWAFEVVSDLGSGMNYQKKGLRRLLAQIVDGKEERLVIMHKDRLLRFGAEPVFAVCEAKSVEMEIVNKGEGTSFKEDLAKDVPEIITVFSARLYGSRSRKNQKLIDAVKKTAEDAQG